ncbi:MAG: BREX system P-loop protein BrxC [Gammaproteobacteria bacterium]
MKMIGELFSKKIDRRIEEVIKVSAPEGADLPEYEKSVQEELEEYVATDAIKDHFCTVFKAVADAPADPHEGIGIWVSGFFGSGKSSFAKILGYTLAARRLSGTSSSEIFKQVVKDTRIGAFLDSINARIPTDAVVFDVSMERGVRTASERITEIMYKALLRELDYADDFDLAELELSLEVDGLLAKFRTRFQELHEQLWEKRRKLGRAVNEASAVLNNLYPKTYPYADSWAKSLGQGRADINPNQFAERAFELMARRRPGRSLVFVIDEVGQYVARSVQKMLDLMGVVQAFGVTGKNRVRAKKSLAPCWIVVTSQEKLNEVVDSLEGKKIELARLQDRFPIAIDLKQSDISEVTGKRVLEKSPDARKLLADIYTKNEGRLKTCCVLERTTRDVSLQKNEFVNLYPYVPYQIDLCIDIVAGLRLKRGAQRHIGGSNRTIIKQAQQMLVHPRTNLAGEPIGALVTLDRVYELLYLGNLLPSEVTREVDEIPKHLPSNAMAHKVAKAIALLEAVKDLPRTPHNIAVALHPTVEADFALEEVKAALKALEQAQIVRESEEGYKLLTVEEKHWDIERSGLAPKPVDRNRIKRELLGEIFADPKVKNYRHKNIRPFKVALSVDGEAVNADGQIAFNASLADDPTDFADRCKDARAASNDRKNEIFWVVTLTEEIHRLLEELHRSREMVSRYEREQAAGKLSPDRSACLAEEKIRRDRVQRDLRIKLAQVLHTGAGFFRGVQKDGSALGHSLSEVVQGLLEYAVPHLYAKLEMGARPLKGDGSRSPSEAGINELGEGLSSYMTILSEGLSG